MGYHEVYERKTVQEEETRVWADLKQLTPSSHFSPGPVASPIRLAGGGGMLISTSCT